MNLYYTRPEDSLTKIEAADIKVNYLVPTITCGCCGCKKFKKLIPLYKKPLINYIKCIHCGAVTYDRIYSQQGLDEMYQDDHYYDDYEKKGTSKITFYGAERLANHILKHIDIHRKKKLSILDFGGGDGEISYIIAQKLLEQKKCKFVNIIVVDYNDSLYPVKSSNIRISHCFPLDKTINSSFDIVLASAIIEHLPNPGEHIKKLFDVTKKGGYVYFRTPYNFPIYKFLKKFGINFVTSYPGHIWDLGQDWWNNMVSSIGYPNDSVKLVRSCPSIVEKSLRFEFFNAAIAYILKSIWWLDHRWKYVGGWETIYKKLK